MQIQTWEYLTVTCMLRETIIERVFEPHYLVTVYFEPHFFTLHTLAGVSIVDIQHTSMTIMAIIQNGEYVLKQWRVTLIT